LIRGTTIKSLGHNNFATNHNYMMSHPNGKIEAIHLTRHCTKSLKRSIILGPNLETRTTIIELVSGFPHQSQQR